MNAISIYSNIGVFTRCLLYTAYTNKIKARDMMQIIMKRMRENKNGEITYKQIKKLKTAMPLGAAN